jgi:hypothetical protein
MNDSSERRKDSRKPAHFVAEIENDGEVVACAVSRDASARGLLLLTHASPDAGSELRFRLYVPDEPSARELSGQVVRVEKMAPGESDLWSHRVAVQLNNPPADLEQLVDMLAK